MAKEKANEPAPDEQQATQPGQQEAPEQKERKLDYAPHGGRYIVNGQLVDANGEPVRDR